MDGLQRERLKEGACERVDVGGELQHRREEAGVVARPSARQLLDFGDVPSLLDLRVGLADGQFDRGIEQLARRYLLAVHDRGGRELEHLARGQARG